MNYVIGKFGRSILFNPEKWGAIGGDNEPSLFFQSLSYWNPEDTFYLLGKSDFEKLSKEKRDQLFPNQNVINLWKDFDKNKHNITTYPTEVLSNTPIDGGIFYSGPASNVNIPNTIWKVREPNKYCKCLMMAMNYASPIIWYLNSTGIPYVNLYPDPRYFPLPAKDLFNNNVINLSQFNTEKRARRIKSYEDQSIEKPLFKTKYRGIEKVFLIGREKEWIQDKNTKFLIVLNEGGNGAPKRGPELKKYILDHFNDVNIYGKWEEEWYKDTRFKGPLKFEVLQEKLRDVKYTFCIPINKGWVTSKFWEMIYYGIIPFLHPDYDTQKHIKCPEFIRVKNPEDLKEKIQYLEENPDYYWKLRKELYDMMTPGDFDGTNAVYNVMSSFYSAIGKDNYKLGSPKVLKEDPEKKEQDILNLIFGV